MIDMIENFRNNGFVVLRNIISESELNDFMKMRENIIFQQNRDLYKISKDNLKKFNKTFSIKQNSKEEILKNGDKFFKNLKELKNYLSNQISVSNYDDEKIHEIFSIDSAANFSSNCDLLSYETFLNIFFKDKLKDIYKKLLQTDELVYWGESGFTYNKLPIRGWHSDDPYHWMLKRKEDTFQIRVAFYPDSVEGYSGGVKLLQSSHKYNNLTKTFKNLFKYLVKRDKSFKDSIKNFKLFFKAINYFPGPRDLLIWDKRIFHSPWASKIKFLESFSFNPSIENLLPKSLTYKSSFPRSITTFDLGCDNLSLKNYLNNWISKREDYKPIWDEKKKILNDKFIVGLKKFGIKFDNTCIK